MRATDPIQGTFQEYFAVVVFPMLAFLCNVTTPVVFALSPYFTTPAPNADQADGGASTGGACHAPEDPQIGLIAMHSHYESVATVASAHVRCRMVDLRLATRPHGVPGSILLKCSLWSEYVEAFDGRASGQLERMIFVRGSIHVDGVRFDDAPVLYYFVKGGSTVLRGLQCL